MPKQMTAEQKLTYMTETPLPRLVLSLSVPTIVSMLITSFYNMADTYFVGLIGSASASGAVGVAFPLMAIMQAVGFMFGHGSGNHMARELGAGDAADARKMAATGFFSAFFVGLAIMTIGLLAAEPLAYALGSTPTIAPYAMEYLGYLMPGAPFLIASLVLNNQLRFQGSAFYAMIGITSGAVLNIILDPLFIFTFGMGGGRSRAGHQPQPGGQLLSAAERHSPGRQHSHPLAGLHAYAGQFPRNSARRCALPGAAEPQQPGHRVPQPGLRWLWRRGHCSYEHRYPRDDDDGERHHWLWTGLPAHLRIQLWGRPV